MLGDRDYMRAERFGAEARQGPSLVAIIIWVNVAVYVLQMFGMFMVTEVDPVSGREIAVPAGGLSREALSQFEFYRLFTYMFVHSNQSLLHILGNMLLVYFAGKRVLSLLGPRHFLMIYFLGGVLGALAQLAFEENYLIGASAGAFALLCAFATLMPEMELLMLVYFVIPVRLRAKYLALGIVGISVLILFVNLIWGVDSNIAHVAHLGGALLGWYYVRALGYGGSTVSLADLKRMRSRRRAMAPRGERKEGWAQRFRRDEVVDAKEEKSDASVPEEVDRVLDKIIREGFQSLTKDERRILEEGSEYINRRVNRR
jgi:membrane associated rhomboid family serine protease